MHEDGVAEACEGLGHVGVSGRHRPSPDVAGRCVAFAHGTPTSRDDPVTVAVTLPHGMAVDGAAGVMGGRVRARGRVGLPA